MDSSHSSHNKKPQTSPTQMFSSAKVVAEAAKATLHHETGKVDKAKVADAAANLLGAASHYGKLEEKGFGKYMEKAENYLHQYHTTHSSSAHSGDDAHGAHPEKKFGEYVKVAGEFMKKH